MVAFGTVMTAAVALGGCAVHSRPAVGYVEVSSAPLDVSVYPHTYYDGRDVYFVRDRWMYNDGGRWAYYVNEPPALYRQRRYVQQAPPAYSYPRAAPPAYGGPGYGGAYRTPAQPRVAPPASAPPARRIP
jgi:hypothetical protein